MRETSGIGQKAVAFFYILALIGMISLLVTINITKESPKQETETNTYKNISESWTLDKEGTLPVDVRKLGEYMDEETGVLSMYYQLPEMDADTSLVYRSKDVYTKVLVDDTVIYETDVYNSRFYNNSPGNLWNVLSISSKYSEKMLEIQIIMVYDTKAITVDSLLIGDKADIIMDFFADNMFGIVVSLLLILLGVVLLVVDLLPSYGRSKRHHGLFWIAIYAFMTGVWSLIETNVVQFCVDDMRILQLMDNMIMMVDTLPLLLYLDSEYQMLKNKGMRFLAYLGIGYMLLCVGLQYSGKRDLHHMLNNGLYIMIVTDVAMIIWLVCRAVKLAKEKLPVLNCLLLIIGLTLNCSSSIFETFRSLRQDRMDRAGLIRIGMLALCICFAIGSQVETYKIVEQGLKYDLISRLAYSDGLTGLGNRTAYLEQLESYENSQKENLQLGIVYLDVNNLKLVNDKQGHEYGDELIKGAAKIIENSFGTFGKAYRIGGDEFCVLMTGNNLKEKYGEGLDMFRQLIAEANKINRYDIKIQIAHGFAVCKEITKDKIEEAIAVADSEMYHNKTELKRGA
ncbi:MAG: GGDEF domain-containing protein [Lachnospiraceae bacterium]|nr:GGDEF domain-containing protein [Lachnospiraceae bacterium]